MMPRSHGIAALLGEASYQRRHWPDAAVYRIVLAGRVILDRCNTAR